MKDFLFNLVGLSIGIANTGVFVLMRIKRAVYIYDNTPVLYLEILLSILFSIWAGVRIWRMV